jgi:hypothetical protein
MNWWYEHIRVRHGAYPDQSLIRISVRWAHTLLDWCVSSHGRVTRYCLVKADIKTASIAQFSAGTRFTL